MFTRKLAFHRLSSHDCIVLALKSVLLGIIQLDLRCSVLRKNHRVQRTDKTACISSCSAYRAANCLLLASNSAFLLLERLFLRILSHKIAKYANIHIVVAEIAIFVSLSDVMYYVID